MYLAQLESDQSYAPAGTQVAVKVLDPGCLSSENIIDRFEREAALGKQVQHPAVVRTLDFGCKSTEQTDFHFLVLEYLEGKTLRDLMRQLGVLPEALLRDLALQIASGLEAIHAAGAAHRDLKPGNILITPSYQVKLMDLGLAFLMESDARLTRDGFFVGTLLYASPEQIRGEAVGPPTDLYSFGVVLYEAATGVHPFEGAHQQETIQRQLKHRPPRAGDISPQLTPFFEEILACLMEKRAEDRFSSSQELLEVLRTGEASSWWEVRQKTALEVHPEHLLHRVQVDRETPFVGRFKEMQTLRTLYRDAQRGHGQVVFLEGEAGVGKTRLLDELACQLNLQGEDFLLLYGAEGSLGAASSPKQFHPDKVRPFAQSSIARSILGHLGPKDLEKKIARYLAATPYLAPDFTAALTDQDGADSIPEDSIEAVLAYLACIFSAPRPVLWFLENLHLAGPDTRRRLAYLAQVAQDNGVLLVGTLRPKNHAASRRELFEIPGARRLELRRLSRRQVAGLLRELLNTEAATATLGRQLSERSDGNPFFIVEMVRDLRDQELQGNTELNDHYSLAEARSVRIPESVRRLLLERLAQLGEVSRSLLEVCAVQGVIFDPDLVARTTEQKRLQILELLAEVESRSGIIRAAGARFSFDHPQLQAVLYDSLPVKLKAGHHRALAEAYEAREALQDSPPEELTGRDAAWLARHFLLSGDSGRGLRTVLAGLDFLEDQFRNEELLELASLALAQISNREPALRCDILLRQARCLGLRGRQQEEHLATDRALAAARAAGCQERIAEATLATGRLKFLLEDYQGARDLLERSLSMARRLGMGPLEREILGHLGTAALRLGQTDEALESFSMLLDRREGRPSERQQALALYYQGCAHQRLGFYPRAREELESAIPALRSVNALPEQARALAQLGITQRYLGDYREARVELERSLGVARKIGDVRGALRALLQLGRLSLEEGKIEESRNLLQACLKSGRSRSLRRVEGFALLHLGELARRRGHADRAELLYQEALTLHHSLAASRSIAQTSFALGRLLVEQGNSRAAHPLFTEAAALVDDYSLVNPGQLPRAYLALIGEVDAAPIEAIEGGPAELRAEVHWLLHRMGRGGPKQSEQHMQSTVSILESLSAHLSPVELKSFQRYNPIARALNRQRSRSPSSGHRIPGGNSSA